MKTETAIYETAHRIGIEELAVMLSSPQKRESANTMQHKANPHDPSHYFTPRQLVTMQAMSGSYSIMHAMAAELGGQFIEPKRFAHLSDDKLLELFTTLMVRNGDFAGDFQRAWADGSLTPKEFAAINDDLYQIHQVCAELAARMVLLVDERPKRTVNVANIRPGA